MGLGGSFFFSSRRRHTRFTSDWSSDVCSSDLITFLGVTFKPNTDDMRQSSSLLMIPCLQKKGAKISYYDPSGEKNEFKKLKNVQFHDNAVDACTNSDLIIIHTEWEEFKALDFNKLNRKKKFKIYDMRNLYSVELMKKKGFNYYSIGR